MARDTLRNAAASAWGVRADACTVRDGMVQCGARVLRFGEIVQQHAPLEPAREWHWKPAAEFRLIGQSPVRLDAATKADGTAVFGIDVRRPEMLMAAVAMAPTIGGSLRAFDASPARAMPGVREIVSLRGVHGSAPGVAVIATNWPMARRALEAMSLQWEPGPHASLASSVVLDALRQEATQPGGRVFRRDGDAPRVIEAARASEATARTLVADFHVPYLAHTTMEPPNCTVQLHDRGADVWVGTQVPKQARDAVARVLSLPPERVSVHVPYLGGGFGRRLEVDFIGQAAEIARAVPGTPVQVIWSREDDVRHDFFRPACAARLSAALDARGAVTAFTATVASQEIVRPYGARAEALPARFDVRKATVEGLFDQPYAFGSTRVAHRVVSNAVPVGYWRAVGHSHNGFFMECFIDELAAMAQTDPITFRASLLASHPRALAVLQLAATASDWANPLAPAPDGAPMARGVALHRSFGSIVAQVAEVSVSASRQIRVHRVVCAVDCGLAIHPDGVAQQMESAVVFGLSAALHGEITIEAGRVVQGNFDGYPALRMAETPHVITHLMPSTEVPEGVGEIGVPPIAPAVANALYALTGTRLRQLPLRLPPPAVAPVASA
jgi:isoquinoline 1-oxidoreductase beta subunit